MTYYDFTVADSSGQRVLGALQRDSTLACVDGLEKTIRQQDPGWCLPEHEEVRVIGRLLLEALAPLAHLARRSNGAGTDLASLNPEEEYLVSWGGF